MFGFGAASGGNSTRGFEEQYHVYPVSFQDKDHLEEGDKILLPTSALDSLARLHVEYPMLFEVSNPIEGKRTHCGVLEFSAEEGSCFLPYWMMQNLLLEAGSLLTIKNVSLPKATFVKFQPQSVDFLDISNPKAVLETQLRNFSCVTKSDHLCIHFNGRKYYMEVKEVKPADAACIIETDCNVDFDAPVGYEEHLKKQMAQSEAGGAQPHSKMNLPVPMSAKASVRAIAVEQPFVPFVGGGARLDGKPLPAPCKSVDTKDEGGCGSDLPASKSGPPLPVKSIGGKFSKRRAHQTGAFSGKGQSMS
jgi:ubiquitin fusion degradation protein 1